MFQPRIPVNPLPTGLVTPPIQPTTTDIEPVTATPAPVPTAPTRTAIELTPGSALALAAGGGAVVLVVGAVLVSMLLAVAITGASIAVVAIVLRLLVRDMQKGR
ncbi:SpdD-like protein [Streptomyces sp. NPDC002463]|uniref:SpdD-like protein n=1 Tax=Streptomyces sp. NPDC002463 TaxID=3364645 RepID=UPI003698352F